MKFVIYGVGAIGGVIAAKLALSGAEVVGIARGPQLAAIRDNGLLLRTPDGEARARFGAAGDPDELPFAADDVIILAMKTQDTPVALQRLRAAGAWVEHLPIAAFDALQALTAQHGTIPAAEAYVLHRAIVDGPDAARLDPRVLARIQRGATMMASDLVIL